MKALKTFSAVFCGLVVIATIEIRLGWLASLVYPGFPGVNEE